MSLQFVSFGDLWHSYLLRFCLLMALWIHSTSNFTSLYSTPFTFFWSSKSNKRSVLCTSRSFICSIVRPFKLCWIRLSRLYMRKALFSATNQGAWNLTLTSVLQKYWVLFWELIYSSDDGKPFSPKRSLILLSPPHLVLHRVSLLHF